jgi:hypothetical protein
MFKYGNLSSVSIGNSKSLIPRNLTFRQNDMFKSTSVFNNIINENVETSSIINDTNIIKSTDLSNGIYFDYTIDSFLEVIITIKGQKTDLQDYGYCGKFYGSVFDISNNPNLDIQIQYENKINNSINLIFTIENSKIKISMDNINNIKSSNISAKIIF